MAVGDLRMFCTYPPSRTSDMRWWERVADGERERELTIEGVLGRADVLSPTRDLLLLEPHSIDLRSRCP